MGVMVEVRRQRDDGPLHGGQLAGPVVRLAAGAHLAEEEGRDLGVGVQELERLARRAAEHCGGERNISQPEVC